MLSASVIFRRARAMKRLLPLLIPALILTTGAGPLQAFSQPIIQGQVSGLEWCAQDTCGSANFVALYAGRVGNIPLAFGLLTISVNHQPLPTIPGQCRLITGGSWDLFAGGRHIQGAVAGGTLQFNGPVQNSYNVAATLNVGGSSSNQLYAFGLLDHKNFPPTIAGALSQIPPPDLCVN